MHVPEISLELPIVADAFRIRIHAIGPSLGMSLFFHLALDVVEVLAGVAVPLKRQTMLSRSNT